ncbi:hypothetical protein STHU_20560 [Allostella humosa]|nr:hypothetical protein STHU_20560 [Stella humosa]
MLPKGPGVENTTMKTIDLGAVRRSIAGTKLAGHGETADGPVRQDTAKVGKRLPAPTRD